MKRVESYLKAVRKSARGVVPRDITGTCRNKAKQRPLPPHPIHVARSGSVRLSKIAFLWVPGTHTCVARPAGARAGAGRHLSSSRVARRKIDVFPLREAFLFECKSSSPFGAATRRKCQRSPNRGQVPGRIPGEHQTA